MVNLSKKDTQKKETSGDRVAREDLTLFINACFACTGQNEFYGDSKGQAVSIEFLHQYILGNYRKLYARTLAAQINHFNQKLILQGLLETGRETTVEDKEEESKLINTALATLPPQRVLGLFETLRLRRVNNRRTRAVIRDYLNQRPNPTLDAVKYRNKVRCAVAHAHVHFKDERNRFLFGGWKTTPFKTPLFENFRLAHYAKEAVYKLPYTIAEGFAAKHGIPREHFLKGIQDNMTQGEKLRLQKTNKRYGIKKSNFNLEHAPLTKLALFILSLSQDERVSKMDQLRQALAQSAKRTLPKKMTRLGRVAAVLDNSYSSSGSSEKKRRPLAVALGVCEVLKQASTQFRPFWTGHNGEDLLVAPKGQTDLATPLIDALEWNAELIVVVSDGYENAPLGAVNKIFNLYTTQIKCSSKAAVIHVNPVFDSENWAPKTLGESMPTVGLYNAEDLLTMLGFAKFAAGFAPLEELESYLEARMAQYLNAISSPHNRKPKEDSHENY